VTQDSRERVKRALLVWAFLGLAVGIGLRLGGYPGPAVLLWQASVLPILAALLVEIARSLGRGEVGLDIVAALSMSAALIFGETLAAAVVAVMYSGGTVLESLAEGRARREMSALLSRVPRSATRHRDGALEEVALDQIVPGDRLFIRQGDVVPVDGSIASETAFVDTSALTGESLPQRLIQGAETMSGATNAGAAFDMLAIRPASESTYAGIVRLVEAAQRSKAPMSRLADLWSLGFLVVTVAIAAAAWWTTGDPIRAVAVLVVATPCPLILAVPIALVAGMSRAAHFGVLVKGAGPLEAMARIRTLILDKTGTLTDGRPRIVSVELHAGFTEDEVLRYAAALDQASKHPVGQAVVAAAVARQLALPVPSAVAEEPGEGVEGLVEGRRVLVGGVDFVAARLAQGAEAAPQSRVAVGAAAGGAAAAGAAAGAVLVAVAVDGVLAGTLVMADPLRQEVGVMLAALRAGGVERILLATGDRAEVAERVTEGLGLDALRAGLTPGQKVDLVLAERARAPVMMVGDGINDAPALAAADVGVAMGARGAAASAEAADVVLLVDQIGQLSTGLQIARRARGIALQSVAAGIGLSVVGMIAAAFGYLTPVEGALLQEAIDVAVILNSLRALRIPAAVAALDRPDMVPE
jgi:heavy metal translocating P-type ATPase